MNLNEAEIEIELPLLNGYSGAIRINKNAFGELSYYVDVNKYLIAKDDVIAMLPVGFRPIGRYIAHGCTLIIGGTLWTLGKGVLHFQDDGQIIIYQKDSGDFARILAGGSLLRAAQ